ncbi:MAG: patatin-like phospholipase family protein [Woeseiaceae bacterium]|nr:patatin-like phospholipase family protein [Woeseiaceae bacterium]
MAAQYHFRNLVFEGGGVKGVAYVGALGELRRRGVLDGIERVAGTSAGAINAVLFATGHSQRETTEILLELDFRRFLDDSWGLVRDTRRLVRSFGWYAGDFFRRWIGRQIKARTGNPDTTFRALRDLGRPDLYLVGTNLSTGFSEVMSAEHTPDMAVADAVRVSMSIPLFFAAVRDRRKDVLVDGGVLRNYPVKIFDREHYIAAAERARHARSTEYYARDNAVRVAGTSPYCYNRETLGFRLDAREEIALFRDGRQPQAEKIGDFFDYGSALIRALLNVQNNMHLHSDDWQRTIYIDTLGIGATDFSLSNRMKRKLLRAGADGVSNYFDWYDDPDESPLPCNHPRSRR